MGVAVREKIAYIVIAIACILTCYVVFANAETGYYKSREVVTTGIDYPLELDTQTVVKQFDLESGVTKDVIQQTYKIVPQPWTKKVMVIDDKALGACLMSGTTPSPAWMGKDLREVAEIKADGWQALVLHETRIGRWTTDDPSAFGRITPQQWKAEGYPKIALNKDGTKMIHPWRKPSGAGWMRGPTYEQLLEAIK